jgi:uncharacterized protein (DUF58 family)
MHRSPYLGSSVEFAQHRGYVPGDDLKHLDWKVWGKNERFYIKQYQAETNLVCWVLCDVSASMAYTGPQAHNQLSKLAYAQLCSAAVSWLVLSQSDAVGLCTFTDGVQAFLPRSSRKQHLARICDELEQARPEPRTGLGKALGASAERIRQRGIVVLVSDLFVDPEELSKGMARLKHDGHDVIVVQVLDDDELRFPFEGMVQFHGLELDAKLLVNPRQLRQAYLDEMKHHLQRVEATCARCGVEHVLAPTNLGVDVVLQAYFNKRAAMANAGARRGGGR